MPDYSHNTFTELASKGVDKINSQVAAHVFANTAMENIYQGEIEKGGRGVTQEYSDNTTGSTISVIRPLPLPIKARQLGAVINGGNFSSFRYESASDSYDLKVITVIDDIVDIPNVSLDMIPVSVANMYIKNVSDKVTLNVNAIKLAAAFYTSFSAEAVNPANAYVTRHQANDSYIKNLMKTYVQLDKGDADNGVTMFPQDDRIGLITVDAYAEVLSANGVFAIGGANKGYDILRKGTIDAEGSQTKLADGYVGDMFGVPFHTVAPLVWGVACDYLGFPRNTFDDVIAIVKSAHGNLFALATGSSVKTIDCPLGQGVRLLPLFRIGASCIMPKANSFLVGSSFENPYQFKEIFGAGIEWGYIAPGSRRELAPTIATSASKKATVTCAGATKVAWVQTAECYSLSDFLSAYNEDDAVKGTGAVGVELTLTGTTGGSKVYFAIVDAEGTIVLKDATVVA